MEQISNVTHIHAHAQLYVSYLENNKFSFNNKWWSLELFSVFFREIRKIIQKGDKKNLTYYWNKRIYSIFLKMLTRYWVTWNLKDICPLTSQRFRLKEAINAINCARVANRKIRRDTFRTHPGKFSGKLGITHLGPRNLRAYYFSLNGREIFRAFYCAPLVTLGHSYISI